MNADQYNQCVNDFADPLYRFLMKSLRDRDQAKDIVQATFEKLWERHLDISAEKAKSWLFTTAYHKMIDDIRHNSRKIGLEKADLQNLSYQDEYTGIKDMLDKGLNLLPENQKNVLLLRDYEGYAYDEISEITGLNESQVKVYIYRARIFLKEYITKIEAN